MKGIRPAYATPYAADNRQIVLDAIRDTENAKPPSTSFCMLEGNRISVTSEVTKVPVSGRLLERTARWRVSASSIGLEIMAYGARYARISLDDIGAVGTNVSMTCTQKWRDVKALAKPVLYYCRAMWDFSATRHVARHTTL